LDVRQFAVQEAISEPYGVSVVALSPNANIPFDKVIGSEASFEVAAGERGTYRWRGVCSSIELVEVPAELPRASESASPAGLSTYHVCIVPKLWLTTQRRNNRIFEKGRRAQAGQKNTIPAIVKSILAESCYGIAPELRLDEGAYVEHDYRVQYGESDFDFVSRLLEEVGICYFFSDVESQASTLVLADSPQTADVAAMRKLQYLASPGSTVSQFATDVHISSLVRPGVRKRRGFDFKRPDYQDESEAAGADPVAQAEGELYEDHYVYREVARDVEGTAKGEEADRRTTIGIESQRSEKRRVSFVSDALGLGAGEVVEISGHPSLDGSGGAMGGGPKAAAAGKKLLVVRSTLSGTHDGEWLVGCDAVFAELPFRPAQHTPKPYVSGVQSAVVVGPAGQEIYTDRDGRVRVQFHWDREGQKNEYSSCWVRVGQWWAGGVYGFITIPRIDQEVLVAFWDGDPEQPVVVGRVYNGKNVVPYKLPDEKTKSTWKSHSSPDAEGFNEIMFEDLKGHELVWIHAQRDLQQLVKHDADERTRNNRTIDVGVDRSTVIVGNDTTLVGKHFSLAIGDAEHGATETRIDMEDGAISLTTGKATVLLDGSDITLKADGDITITADGEVVIHGGPLVKINC
jgi:type VI secretion system secreted protein VgrG